MCQYDEGDGPDGKEDKENPNWRKEGDQTLHLHDICLSKSDL